MTASLGFLSKTTWLQNLKIATTKAEILNFSQNQNQARNWNLESINRCQAQSFYNNNNIQISIPPQVARTGENHLLCGEIKDAFASFRQLKQKCATSTEGTGWETTVRQGICCCKVAGALQHFTKSAYTVSPWRSLIWSTGIHARFHHWQLPSYDHWGP